MYFSTMIVVWNEMLTSPAVLLVSFVSTLVFPASGEIVITIVVNLNISNANVDGLFVSNSMPHKISKWNNMPFKETKFRELFKALAPSSLRVLANPKKTVSDDGVKEDPVDMKSSENSLSMNELRTYKRKNKLHRGYRSVDRSPLDHFRSDQGIFHHGKSDQVNSGKVKFDYQNTDQENSGNVNKNAGKNDQVKFYPGKIDHGTTTDRGTSDHEYSAEEKFIAHVPRAKRGSSIPLTVDKSEADMQYSNWDELYSFIQYVGWNISMDFTNLDRKEDGTWDSTAADEFLEYAVENNIRIPDFQIGNEPNLYHSKYNISYITPENTLQDFQAFRNKLNGIDLYKNSILVGPETTRPSSSREYFVDFLAKGGCSVVDEISFHQYYRNLDKHSPTVNDFLNTSIMDLLEMQFSLAKGHMNHYSCNKPIRLTETSSISGGLPDIADRFVAGFLWLDKLGVAARSGVTRVYRFNIWGGSYSLLDRKTFEPNSDYYLTLLYKRLVEGKVYNVTTDNKNVRAYANAAKPAMYPNGSLVIYVVNVLDKPVKLFLKQFTKVKVDTYFFTAGDNTGVLAKTVKVSGVLMKHNKGGNVTFQPVPARADSVQMPPLSFGFVVVPKSPNGKFEEEVEIERNSAIITAGPWNGLRTFVANLVLWSCVVNRNVL